MTGIETVAIWIAGKTVGALVEPVLKSLAQDIAKDIAKDKSKGFINKYLGRAANLIPHDDFIMTYGKVIRELVDTIDEELRNVGVAAHDTVAWTKDIQAFVKSETVRDELAQAFTSSTGVVNGNSLRIGWQLMTDITPLSPEFDWVSVAKNFNRKLRELRANDVDFRAVLQAQASVETAENTKNIAGLQPKSDLNEYRKALLKRYANLHFDTLDTTGAFEAKRQLWNIFVAQTVRDCLEYRPQDLEIPIEHRRRLTEQGEWDSAELQEEILELRRRNYLEQVPRSVLEAVRDDRLQRLVILGDPGSGKSSLLRYLALEWANIPDAVAREAAPLSLIIELREYNTWDCPNGKSVVRYLHDAQNWYRLDQHQIHQRLSQPNGAVLLLDGLDEIFDPTRRELAINDITRFSNEYPNIKIIVTSRVIGYRQQRLSDAEFRHLMLQDLEEPQIHDFLERWHNETFDPNRIDREAKKARLAKAINDSRAIRELAGNPLLLTMMAILNRHQELPRDRARLYEQASRVLLHEWDTERTLESHPQLKGIIGHQEKAEMLLDIAYFMQSNATGKVGNIIARGELERIVREYLQKTLGIAQPHSIAKALVEQLRERNFILCFLGADSYAFVHRTFLEYFCASAIVREFRQRLSLDYLKDEVFDKHWEDETWHEVLRLISGLVADSSIEQSSLLIQSLLEKQDWSFELINLFLAAQCYLEIRNPQSLETLRNQITSSLNYVIRPSSIFSSHTDITVKCIRLLTNPHLDGISTSWLEAIRFKNPSIRREVVRMLATDFYRDPEISKLLINLASNEKDEIVATAAIHELAIRQEKNATILPFLIELSKKHVNPFVRHRVMKELTQNCPIASFHLLLQIALEYPFGDVRQLAIQRLASYFANVSATLDCLKKSARQDPNKEVRRTALRELARVYKNDPEASLMIQEFEEQQSSYKLDGDEIYD